MRKRKSVWKAAAVIAGFLLTTGCEHYMSVVTTRDVRLVTDSAEVQGLVAKQSSFEPRERMEVGRFFERLRSVLNYPENKDAAASQRREIDEMYRHPETYIPERIAFLDAMEQAPGFAAPLKTEGEIIQRSEAVCSRNPDQNPSYVKVRITSGPLKGREGWGCEGDGIARTVIMP